jgi:hypothetical protein
MSSLHFSFGDQIQTGELARGLDPANEIEVEMAVALGQPPGPWPPFAILPVLLNGSQIGVIEKIVFVNGSIIYQFRSQSGNTVFSCLTPKAVLQRLSDLLQ